MAVDKHTMRLGLYRKVEIARKQLPNMDEEAFRALLRSEFGVESRKDMTIHQLSRLVHDGTWQAGLDRDHGFHALCRRETANPGYLAQAGLFHDQSEHSL